MKKYDLTTRLVHWFSALSVFSLFISGWYMVDLDYYSPWYLILPQSHQLLGLVLLLLWVFKLFRMKNSSNLPPLDTHQHYEHVLAKVFKWLFYISVFVITLTGYFFSTAADEVVTLFNIITLPKIFSFSATAVDTMGLLHEYFAYLIVVLAVLHALAAIKHHFFDKDTTLKRML